MRVFPTPSRGVRHEPGSTSRCPALRAVDRARTATSLTRGEPPLPVSDAAAPRALLGHDKLETTARYTRVATGIIAKIESPLKGLNVPKAPTLRARGTAM